MTEEPCTPHPSTTTPKNIIIINVALIESSTSTTASYNNNNNNNVIIRCLYRSIHISTVTLAANVYDFTMSPWLVLLNQQQRAAETLVTRRREHMK